jgi:hypothetical protein
MDRHHREKVAGPEVAKEGSEVFLSFDTLLRAHQYNGGAGGAVVTRRLLCPSLATALMPPGTGVAAPATPRNAHI